MRVLHCRHGRELSRRNHRFLFESACILVFVHSRHHPATNLTMTIFRPAAVLLLILLCKSAHTFLKPSIYAVHAAKASTTQLRMFDFINEGKIALVKTLAGDYDEVAVRARLNGLVNDNPVFMLSFTTCPYCIKAKEVLDSKGAKYTVVEADVDRDGKALRAELGELVGRTSVPAIWIGGDFVGGCNDGPMGGVVKLNDEGKLDGMLQSVGAL